MAYQLKPSDLYQPSTLSAAHLAASTKKTEIIGQEKALEALNFGIHMNATGYNIFCVGPKGVGRTTLSLEAVKKYAVTQPAPQDWCYIHNFETPHKPIALCFPAWAGKVFEKTIKHMVDELKIALPVAFSDETYKTAAVRLEQQFQNEKELYFERLESLITEKNVTLVKTDAGVIVAPKVDGQILDPDGFNKLPKATRKVVLEQMQAAQKRVEAAIKETPKWEENQQRLLSNLQVKTAQKVLKGVIGPVEKTFEGNQQIITFLKAISADLIENVHLFADGDITADGQHEIWDKYAVNLFITNKPSAGAPVVHLSHPTLQNLVGKIERIQQSGSVMTDFSMIRPGALHQANGGYLIIEARELLTNPAAWNALKRCLFAKEIKIESASDETSVFDVVSLDPDGIPLSIKIVLIGEQSLYYALVNNDDEFGELFKILAQFTEKMDRTATTEKQYAALMNSIVKRENLKPLSLTAARRLIEYAARLAGDKSYLTTYLARINDIIREASYFAVQNAARTINVEHIEKALETRKDRSGILHHEMMDLIRRKVISINTTDKKVGQLNALVVHDSGTFSFGRPNRVTCQTRLGEGQLIDIEREVELGGPLHSKGVLILSSFLSSRFSQNTPISLDASLVFEQSYAELDGDSASSVELYCLLSSIAGVPLNQAIAATGSVNQLGEVQAIGGVNEKIEGFFEVCKLNGLTGEQGVIIPASNVQSLMLSPEVIEAVKKKQFQIYAVKTIDEGMEILTGLKTGTADKNGHYPKGTLNAIIVERLADFFKKSQKINQGSKK